MTVCVWAIILHYRLWRETLRCAQSLLEGDYPNLHILLVDNGSNNGSAEELRLRLGDRVELLALPGNRFYAGGMNAGLTWALGRGADWLLAMNNDTFVAPDMVSLLVEAAHTRPDVGIVAPVIYYAADPQRIWSAGARRRRMWPFAQELARQGQLWEPDAGPLAVDYVTGCAMLLRCEALQAAGLFDPRYRMYYEDVDLCERVRQAGYQILTAPGARMWHLVGRTAGEEPALNRYHHTRNRWRFYMVHTQGLVRFWAGLLLLMQEGARCAGFMVRGRFGLARAQWAALRDALLNTENGPI
jgi:hypothetical protein